MKQAAIFVIAAIALFLIGRWTAPVTVVEDKRKIDSLVNDLDKAIFLRDQAEDSMNHYRIQSDTWFAEYEKERKTKSVTHTVYDNRKKAIDRLTDADLDSAFRAVYPDK
ncbi:MAG TPA: hypothetical protein PK059_02140 [Cyclobacteriaceae bacterium]|nr:hypothetical protein [Cyclobacteriaceae bacterium]